MIAISPRNIIQKVSSFIKEWTPHIIDELNKQFIKCCKKKNDFVWHCHKNEDKLFMVLKITLLMDFKNSQTVEVNEGNLLILPKVVEYRQHPNGKLFLTYCSTQKPL